MEVSLAVRLGGSASAELVLDTDNSLDEFISNHGFEYIDGDRVNRLPSGERDDLHDEDDSGQPFSYASLCYDSWDRV